MILAIFCGKAAPTVRLLLIPGLLTVAAPAYAGDKEAEKLFGAMEKKIAEAKTIHVRYEMNVSLLGNKANGKGIAVIGENDKFHYTLNAVFGLEKINNKIIGTGNKIYEMGLNAQTTSADSPKALGNFLCAGLSRIGLFFATSELNTSDKDLTKAADQFKATNFKLGVKEKVGNADTQVVERTFLMKEDKVTVKHYINIQTGLPAKMELRMEQGKFIIEVMENYSEFTIDGKVDPKLFEAPK